MAGSNTDGSDGTKRPPGQQPAGGVLHQRRSLPFSPMTMAVGGFLIVGTIGYFTLYAKSKPGTTPRDVARITSGASDGKDTAERRSK